MKIILICLAGICLLSSCFSRSCLMTREGFDDILLGTPIADVESKMGAPYAVHSKGAKGEEYEYIEKIQMGDQWLSENHYFLLVSGGRVVSKRMTRESPPAYDLIYQEDPNHPYPLHEQ